MKKYVNLLEQHVEWVAIGIGAIYLAFTIWAYVLNNPITATVQNTTVTLGNVDETVLQGAAIPLQQKMDSTEPVPGLDRRPEFAAKFIDQMHEGRQQHQNDVMTGFWLDAPTASEVTGTYERHQMRQHGPVQTLPIPPAPALVGERDGRSQVAVPGAAAGTNGQPTVEDKYWVTVEGKISIAPLGQMMTDHKIPPAMHLTEFLRLQLQREEQLPDGKWGNPVIVSPPAYLSIPPMPTGNNSGQYVAWATNNVMLILQPPFLQTLKGDQWYLPSDTATAQALNHPNGPVFDPANLSTSPKTPEQRKARLDYLNSQQYKDLLRQQRNRAPVNPEQSSPDQEVPGAPQGMAPSHSNPDDNAVLAQARIGGPNPPMGGPLPPFNAGPPSPDQGDNPNQPNLPQSNASAAVQKANAELPQGQFDPAKQGDISCWAFDDSAQPGKTYRYRLRYLVFNPVHNGPMAGNPDVSDQLSLISDFSDWTDAVKIQQSVNFFLATGISGDRVNFKIYKWQNGQTSVVSEQDSAGDIIGADHADTNGVNYTTDWTVVAVRSDYNGNRYVLITNPAGQLVRRDYHADDLSPVRRKLQQEVKDAQAAQQAATPAPGPAQPPSYPAAPGY